MQMPNRGVANNLTETFLPLGTHCGGSGRPLSVYAFHDLG
jgi:hypothetical protein